MESRFILKKNIIHPTKKNLKELFLQEILVKLKTLRNY